MNKRGKTMRTSALILTGLVILSTSCVQESGVDLLVENPLDTARNDARILVTRQELSEHRIKIPSGELPLLKGPEGRPVPCQADDVDGDGGWDELFALTDLGPGARETVSVSFTDPASYPSFRVRTNVRLGANEPGYPELTHASRLEGVSYDNHARTGEVYQMEGPAWENDHVGFRNYLDQRNGMDIFGKRTPEMVLDSVGIEGRQSYHEPDRWGMDILKVNTSLGAGSIGYMYKDSIYRVGDSGTGTYHLVFEGPERSRFSLEYSDWKVGEHTLHVNQRVDIVAGTRCYESLVTYTGTTEKMDLVTGIVNMHSDSLYVESLNERYTMLMTHDVQAEDTTMLAMALVVPTASLVEYGQTRDEGEGITQTYYARLSAEPGMPVPYRFYALWEKEDPRWASRAEVVSYLKQEAECWSHPVSVQFLTD
jgi:hypothetical protein